MENENKCFFSISLENGITITSNSPVEVYEFLNQMKKAFYELSVNYNTILLTKPADDATIIFWQINDALETLDKHLNQ